jgi:integrase
VRRQVEEISGRLRVVDYTKTDAGRRTVHPNATVMTALAEHLATLPSDPDALLWPSGTRNGTTNLLRHGNFMRSVFKPAAESLGVSLHWHDLRHIAGRLMAIAGVPLNVIMREMGHDSLEAARRYLTAVESHQQIAAEKMDALLALSASPPASTGTDNVIPLRKP